jgi:hypothetical protein
LPLLQHVLTAGSSTMPFESEKIMFEIYKETAYQGRYKVVYFTELQDHNREFEISRAMAGEHVFDGFIRNLRKEEAKDAIDRILQRLNAGEPVGETELEKELMPFMAS